VASTREQGSTPFRIFLSYRRTDTGGHAGRLYDALAGHFGPENVFMDIDAIDLGVDFVGVINRAVSSCDVVIALIGRQWLTAADADGRPRIQDPNDFVRLELESALTRDVFVIPTCVQGVDVPPANTLPAGLAPLAGRQGTELHDAAWRDDVNRLIRRLESLAREQGKWQPVLVEPERPAARRLPGTKRLRSKSGLAVAALVIALLAGGATALALTHGGSGTSDGATQSGKKFGPAERRLLALISAVIRPSCNMIDYGETSAETSLECSGARLGIAYYLFPSNSVMEEWYVQAREAAAIAPTSGSCTPGAFRGEASQSAGGRIVGKYFCYVDRGEPFLIGADRRVGVGYRANIWEGTGRPAEESLMRQWRCCLQLRPAADS
jgi:hypothetical protein